MSAVKIALFSFADIDNYGDILFSWIVRQELQQRLPDAQFDFYSPSDCVVAGEQYIGYTRERVDGAYDALILVGGEVVHFFDERTWKPIYARRGLIPCTGLPSNAVWDWPVHCTAAYKAWLSVGVRPFEDAHDQGRVAATLQALDHLSVRGVLSKKLLENAEWLRNDQRITVTPDLGWAFPRLVSRAGQQDSQRPYALFQFHNIDEREAVAIAASLLRFREATGLVIYLMPVIHLWNDHEFMLRICEAGGDKLIMLRNDLAPTEMLELIRDAEIVMASSLHVAITALAFGHPAAVFNKWPGTKFQDLLGMQMRPHAFINAVEDIDNTLDALLQEHLRPVALLSYRDFMSASLDASFDRLAQGIVNATV